MVRIKDHLSIPSFDSRVWGNMVMLSLVSLSGMIVLMSIIIWQMHGNVFEERKQLTRAEVVSAIGLMDDIYEKQKSGELSESTARQMTLSHLSKMKYPDHGYFWVLDTNGKMLMHPYSPKIVGTDTSNLRDRNGNYFVRKFLTTARNGGGFVTYDWARPNSEEEAEKVAYVMEFRPWGWVIGSGLYVDDLRAQAIQQISMGGILIFFLFGIHILISLRMSRRYIDEFRNTAIYDGITGLFTRGYLEEIGTRVMQRSDSTEHAKVAAIFFDIDHFKQVNDTYGHRVGDKVLAKVGDVIRSHVRPNELGFRYGGEELVLMLYASEEESRAIAERVRAIIGEHEFNIDDFQFNITLSAGVAIHRKNETLSELLRRADMYMYEAKLAGRNCTKTESEVDKSATPHS